MDHPSLMRRDSLTPARRVFLFAVRDRFYREGRMSRRAEWQNVLDAETKKWSAMSCSQLIATLHDTYAYEVEFESKHYNVEVELLEDTDKYIHVLVAVDDGSLPASISPLTSSFIRHKDSDVAEARD
jgi:hypothetical protein